MLTTAAASTTEAIMLSASVKPARVTAGVKLVAAVRIARRVVADHVADHFAGRRFVEPAVVGAGALWHRFGVTNNQHTVEPRHGIARHGAEIGSEFVDWGGGGVGGAVV